MKFTVETTYDQKAMTVLARVLRKTLRAKRNKRTHIFGWLIIVVTLLLMWAQDFMLNAQSVVTIVAMVVMSATLIWEDHINGYTARKRLLKGLDKSQTNFSEDRYESMTTVGKTQWTYTTVDRIVKQGEYVVFVFDRNHGQVYDLQQLSGGTAEEFQQFLTEKTGKNIEILK